MDKIEEAARLMNSKTQNYDQTDCKNDSEYNTKKFRKLIPLNERSDKFIKFYNTAFDCLWNETCSMNTTGFKNKIYETISKVKTKTYAMEKNYQAKCYIENGKINYTKMISDELSLIEYNVLRMAQKMVSLTISQTTFTSFLYNFKQLRLG